MSEKLINFYKKNIEEHENSVGALAWGSRDSQEKRFEVFSKLLSLNNSSILDVGCGLGDLNTYLLKSNIKSNYTGLDITDDMIPIAKENHPESTFLVGDIRELEPSDFNVDYVLASGIFNLTIEDHEQFIWDSIEKMYAIANKAVAFNIMSEHAPVKNPDNYYASPVEYLDKCMKINKYSLLDHSYMIHDFTIIIFKNEN